MPTLPPPLQLNAATYQPGQNDAWSVQLDWAPLQPPCGTTYFVQMQLFDSADLTNTVGQAVTTTMPNAPSGVWSPQAAGATLDAATVYWIAVRAVNYQANPTSIGAWTYPLPLLYASPPKLAGVRYDGSGLDVVWVAPAGANAISTYVGFVQDANGIVLATLDANGQGYPAGNTNGGSYVRFPLESAPLQLAVAPLSLALAPAWRDAGTGATSYGPADQSGLFTAQPVVASAVYAGGTTEHALSYTVGVRDRDYQRDRSPTFLAVLNADGAPVWETTLGTVWLPDEENPQGTLTLPYRVPHVEYEGIPPGMVLTLSLARCDGVSVGPFGPQAPLPSWPPAIGSLEYQGGEHPAITVGVDYAPGAPLQGAARIEVRTDGGLVATGQVVGRRGTIPVPSLQVGFPYVVTASALAGQSKGPPSPPVSLLMAAPNVTGATLDGRVVRVEWQAASTADNPGLTGFHVSVTSGSHEVAGVTVGYMATSAAVELAAGGEQLAVEVWMVGAVARGPSSRSVALVGEVPQEMGARTDPVTGLTTLTWREVPGAAAYVLQFYSQNEPVHAPVNVAAPPYEIPVRLTPNVPQTVAGAVVMNDGGVSSTGQFSAPYPLPTAQPAGVSVDLDGRSATVTWTGVAGATGYVASLLAGGAAEPVAQATGDTSAVLELGGDGFDLTRTYSVVVQALVDEDSGPPTPPVPLFAPGYAVSTAALAEQAPAIYPVASVAGDAWDVVLYLPELGLPAQVPTIDGGPFSLANRSGEPGADLYPFQLTIAADSAAWQFDASPVRAGLQASYVQFLKDAEGAGATPMGISVLQEVISRAMPQTFQETLFYAYGLDLAAGTADLRPGMVLRVATGGWLTPPGSPVPAYLSGYAASGVADYEVGSYSSGSSWRVGMDAFLAQLVAGGALTVPAPAGSVNQQQQEGAADAADLFYAGFLQPFYRLFAPSPLASASAVGNAYTPDEFVIAAAGSYTTLSSAVPYPSSGGAVAWFRGRAVLKPCIRVWINGVAQVVPIGTTVGNLLDAAAQRVSAGARVPAGMRMFRGLGRAVLDAESGLPAGLTYRVRLGWSTIPAYAPGVDSLSLPLLHGDRLTLPF